MAAVVWQAVIALSAVITALASVGAFAYVRETRQDAKTARRLLEGTQASAGVIERVEDVEEQSEQNTHAAARNRRALRREGLLNPDTQTQRNAD